MTAPSIRGHAPAWPAADHARLNAILGGDTPFDTGIRPLLPEGDAFGGIIGAALPSDWPAALPMAGRGDAVPIDGVEPLEAVLRAGGMSGARIGEGDGADRSELTRAAAGGTCALAGGAPSAHAGTSAPARSGAASASDRLTMTEIARYLTNGFWEDYAGYVRHSHDATQGSVLTCDISALGAAEQRMARMALNAWSEVTGLRFDTTSRAGAGAGIEFRNDDPAGAYSMPTAGYETVTAARVNIPGTWAEGPGQGFDTYFYQTYLHEIGHALGLGHAGPYDGSATYGIDNGYANDSWQATVMSYFNQAENTAVDASFAYVVTPMVADILAIQDLYGAPQKVNGGNSVWGEGGTIAGAFGMANGLLVGRAAVTMTIFDQGGSDWLRLGSDRAAQRIDLSPGAVSSAYGLTGNLSIAQGTVIENAVAGGGHDAIRGNAASNWLIGGAGIDTLQGLGSGDTLEGGAGADRLIGGTGDDLFIADALDTLVEVANGGIDRVRATVNFTLGAHLEALLLIHSLARQGTGNALANTITGNGGVNLLSGGGGNDTLYGLAGNDTLSGDAGADRLVGGAGDDIYRSDAGDIIVEAAKGGFDTAITRHDMVLAAHVEKVVVEGNLGVRVTGRAGNSILIGNDARNLLAGGGGRDELSGGGGGDIFVFTAGQGGRVRDFEDDLDVIRIDGARAAGLTAAGVIAEATESGGGTTLNILDGTLRLDGISLAALRDDLVIA